MLSSSAVPNISAAVAPLIKLLAPLLGQADVSPRDRRDGLPRYRARGRRVRHGSSRLAAPRPPRGLHRRGGIHRDRRDRGTSRSSAVWACARCPDRRARGSGPVETSAWLGQAIGALPVNPRRPSYAATTSAPSSGSSPAVPLLTTRPVRRAPPRTPFAGPTGPVGRVSRAPAHDSGQPNASFTSARCSRSSAAAQDRPPCLDSWPHRYSGLSRNSRLKPLNRTQTPSTSESTRSLDSRGARGAASTRLP